MKILSPVGNFLARVGVHPHILTVTGVVLSALAGLVYCNGSFFWAAWVVVLSGTCDALDGGLARETRTNSNFGAFFDSALDRYSDSFILMGLAWYFAGGPRFIEAQGQAINAVQSPWAVVFAIIDIFTEKPINVSDNLSVPIVLTAVYIILNLIGIAYIINPH